MKGAWVCENEMKFVEVTLEQYMQSTPYLRKFAWFVGRAGSGKSSLQRALSREFSARRKKTVYYEAKAVDPMGILTKEGKMDEFGAIMISDYAMTSLMNTSLDEEDKKSLFQPEERGSVKARYHTAVIPLHMPRTFSCNANNDAQGNANPGGYFDFNDMPGLAAVARGDINAVRASGDAEIAIARRCIVFVIPERLKLAIDNKTKEKELQAIVDEQLEAVRMSREWKSESEHACVCAEL